MSSRATGFRPDPPGTAYPSHSYALRTERATLPTSDLSRFRAGRVYQGHIGCCVFEAVKRAIQLRVAALGGAPAMLVAEICAYACGRKNEAQLNQPFRPPEDLPTLAQIGDTGAYPQLALETLQAVGLPREQDWPGPASGRTDWQAMLDTEPGDAPLVEALDARGLQFAEVDRSRGLRAVVLELGPLACPVMVAINANGIASTDPRSSVVTSLATTGQNHYVCILSGEDASSALIDNWWSDAGGPDGPWGDQRTELLRGTWGCSWAALDAGASNALALMGLPATLARKPA